MENKKVFYQQELINGKSYRWFFHNEDLIIEENGVSLTITKELAKRISQFYVLDNFDKIKKMKNKEPKWEKCPAHEESDKYIMGIDPVSTEESKVKYLILNLGN